MSLLHRKHSHTDVTIQVALTVVAAYMCFYVAEGVLQVSGVLAVVTMGVLLAATFWPLVCSRSTMENVWHTFEWLLNTVLFQLAGLVIGGAVVPDLTGGGGGGSAGDASDHGRLLGAGVAVNGSGAAGAAPTTSDLLSATDLLWALLTYVGCIAVRGLVVLILFPFLRRLGYGMPASDGLVVAWGGLHGSVGLALAMSMDHSLRGAGRDAEGKQVLLHVAMVAVLTLTVNAPSMAPLLRSVGLTSSSEEQDHAFADLAARISDYAWREYHRMLSHPSAALPENEKWLRAIPTWVRLMALTKDDHEGEELPHAAALQVGRASLAAPGGGGGGAHQRQQMRRASRLSRITRLSAVAGDGGDESSERHQRDNHACDHQAFLRNMYHGQYHQTKRLSESLPAGMGGSMPSLEAGSAAGQAAEAEKQPFRHTKHQGIGSLTKMVGASSKKLLGGSGGAGGSRATMRATMSRMSRAMGGADHDAPTRKLGSHDAAAKRLMQVRTQFLLLVKSSYTNMLEDGVMPPRSTLAIDVINSVDVALDRPRVPIYDWLLVIRMLRVPLRTRLVVWLIGLFTRCFGAPAALGRRGAAVLSGLWRLGPHSYGVHAIYLLTCFITAHEEAQEEMHWMYGERQARLHQEEVQIVGESRVAVKRARDYLADLSKIVINGEQLGEVIDGVRARQLSALLIHRIAGFAEQMYEHGLLDQRSVHRLVEQLEHDQIHLPNRVAEEAAAAAGGAGGGGAAAAAAQLGYSHEEMRRGLRELEIVQRKHQVALERMLQMGRSRESLDGLDDGTSEASGTTALFSVAAAAASAVARSVSPGAGCRSGGGVSPTADAPVAAADVPPDDVGSPTHVRSNGAAVAPCDESGRSDGTPASPNGAVDKAASRGIPRKERKRSIVGVAHQAITDAASQAAQKALPSVKYKPGEDKSDFMQLDLGHFAPPLPKAAGGGGASSWIGQRCSRVLGFSASSSSSSAASAAPPSSVGAHADAAADERGAAPSKGTAAEPTALIQPPSPPQPPQTAGESSDAQADGGAHSSEWGKNLFAFMAAPAPTGSSASVAERLDA